MYRLITILLHLLPGIEGAITVNCRATSPASPKSVTCSCRNLGGNGVEWWDDTTISHCFFPPFCSNNKSGYTFSFNQTEQMFIMTISPYNFSDCQQFTCKDFGNTSIQHSQTPSTIDFDSTMPLVIAEPVSNNTSGDISITTSCISGYSELVAEWYIVVNGTKKEYIPDQDIVIRHIDNTTCIACKNESAATIKLGFHHKEAVGNAALEGHIQLELHHPDYPSDKLVRKTTNVYKVAEFDENEECNWCPKFCLQKSEGACLIKIVVVGVVVVVVVVGLVVLAFIICCRCKGKTCDTPSKESIPLREVSTTAASHDKLETTPIANGKSSTKRRFRRIFRLLEGFGGANKDDEEKPNTQKTLCHNVKPMIEIMEKILESLDPDRRSKAVVLTENRHTDDKLVQTIVTVDYMHYENDKLVQTVETIPNVKDKLVQTVETIPNVKDKLVQTVETIPNVKDLQSNLHELNKQIQEILTYRGAEEVTNTLEKFRGDMRQVLISLDSQIVEEKNLIQFEEEESHICEDRAVFTGILGKDFDENYDTPSKESLALQEGNNTRASDEESGKKCDTPSNEYTNSSVKCQTDSSRETIPILNVLDRLRTEIKECKDTIERILNERHSKHLTQSSDSTEVSIVQ